MQLETHRVGGIGTSGLWQHLKKTREEPRRDSVEKEPQKQRVMTRGSATLWKVGLVKNSSFEVTDFLLIKANTYILQHISDELAVVRVQELAG